jgi:hypothetical protein
VFIADALIEAGVEPSIFVNSLGIGPASEALDKYDPDQPRVAAGNPDGGQWTRGDSAGATTRSTTKKPNGVQVADASTTRGHEVASGVAPGTSASHAEGAPGFAVANEQPIELAQNLDQTCSAFIAANCQARVLRVFPGQ